MPTNGSGARHLPNWIEAFADRTANLHSPRIFRVWAGISTIAAALEQKVWIRTSHPIYPNLYTFIIAHPGVGKTRIIRVAKSFLNTLPDPHLAPTSVTFAALVDTLIESKRSITRQPEGTITYYSLTICADELGAFMHKYESEMVDGLSAFYDQDDYGHRRRGNDIKIKIPSPQLNILAGSTPQNLMGFMPDKAWGQGFASRIILVFSDERILEDDFAVKDATNHVDLIHDLKIINSLYGEFHVTESYAAAVNQWRHLGEPPIPDHPRLIHYITRRKVHIYKLSMVASINRGNGLVLVEEDFLQALEWLVSAETHMPDIFKAGAVNADSAAMDEIQHHVRISDHGTGVSEQRVVHFARERIPITSILRIIEIMLGAGLIHVNRTDKKTGARYFSSAPIRASYATTMADSPPAASAPPPQLP